MITDHNTRMGLFTSEICIPFNEHAGKLKSSPWITSASDCNRGIAPSPERDGRIEPDQTRLCDLTARILKFADEKGTQPGRAHSVRRIGIIDPDPEILPGHQK